VPRRTEAVLDQECQAGVALIDDVWKKWVSGERLACRPLFGKVTECYRWAVCAKYWECNKTYPSIKGSPKRLDQLKSFVRRLVVLELQASFTGDETKLDCSNRVFPEDPTLSPFLESPEAKLAYIQVFLIPFMQKYSPADCRRALMNPPDDIRDATRRVIAQMANGGIHPPAEFKSEAEEKKDVAEAAAHVRIAHLSTIDAGRFLNKNRVASIKDLPGTFRQSARSKSKYDNLIQYASLWPYLLAHSSSGYGAGFRRLDIDLTRFEGILLELGADKFNGGLENWKSVWIGVDAT
jgi:hypothetical protein